MDNILFKRNKEQKYYQFIPESGNYNNKTEKQINEWFEIYVCDSKVLKEFLKLVLYFS